MTSAGASERTDSPRLNPVLLAISLGLHLVGFGLAVGIPRLLADGGPGRPVYVVDLVSLAPGRPAPAPAPAGGAPAPKKAASPKPVPEKPIKLPEPGVKPKERKKPPEPKKVETAPPTDDRKAVDSKAAAPPKSAAETKAAAPPGEPGVGAGTGPAGGSGGTGSGQADAITFYAGLLKRRIEGAWLRPLYPQGWSGSSDPTASVRIVVTGSGRVTGLEVVVPSGYEAMDRSILRAVQDAQPFPPFPSELGRDQLSVKIDFVLPPANQ